MKLLTITGQSFSGKKALVEKLLSSSAIYEQIHADRSCFDEEVIIEAIKQDIERITGLGKTAILICPPSTIPLLLAQASQGYPVSLTSLYIRLPKSVACQRMADYVISAIESNVPLANVKTRLSGLLKKEDVTNILPLALKIVASIKLKPGCHDTRSSLTKYLSSRLQEHYESATFTRKDIGEYCYLHQHTWPDVIAYDLAINAENIESKTRPVTYEINQSMIPQYQNQA